MSGQLDLAGSPRPRQPSHTRGPRGPKPSQCVSSHKALLSADLSTWRTRPWGWWGPWETAKQVGWQVLAARCRRGCGVGADLAFLPSPSGLRAALCILGRCLSNLSGREAPLLTQPPLSKRWPRPPGPSTVASVQLSLLMTHVLSFSRGCLGNREAEAW